MCPSGGIGRHSSLKSCHRKVCGFKSHLGYQEVVLPGLAGRRSASSGLGAQVAVKPAPKTRVRESPLSLGEGLTRERPQVARNLEEVLVRGTAGVSERTVSAQKAVLGMTVSRSCKPSRGNSLVIETPDSS